MKRLIPTLMFLTATVFATGVPEIFEVTADNASSLGFEVDDLGMVEKPNYKMGTLKFPNTIDGYVAARIQTYLQDFSGVYVTATSSDAFISDKSPRVLFSYSGDVHDMTICIQYGKKLKEGVRYYRSYCVDSINSLLIPSDSNRQNRVG